jgi:hypothetical protein
MIVGDLILYSWRNKMKRILAGLLVGTMFTFVACGTPTEPDNTDVDTPIEDNAEDIDNTPADEDNTEFDNEGDNMEEYFDNEDDTAEDEE